MQETKFITFFTAAKLYGSGNVHAQRPTLHVSGCADASISAVDAG